MVSSCELLCKVLCFRGRFKDGGPLIGQDVVWNTPSCQDLFDKYLRHGFSFGLPKGKELLPFGVVTAKTSRMTLRLELRGN